MKNIIFKRPLLSSAVAAIVGTTTSIHSHAQEAIDPDEEVVVYGIRASLERAMDVKRESSGVVDAISAEDIGKFPDTNLAESLQRISGVSIDRQNNEGNQVSVRGMGPTFNLVTLNDRVMPSSDLNTNRAFNFANLAAESVSGVEVYKTSKASKDSGGIGSTINIKTARPLDLDPFKIAGSIKALNDTTTDEVTPEISGLFSHKWADDMFGILVNASYSERKSEEQRVAIDGWIPVDPEGWTTLDDSANQNPDGTVWHARNYNVGVTKHDRKRTNAMVVFQFAPSDSLTATLDYHLSDFEDHDRRNQLGVWFNGADSFTPPGRNPVTNSNGTVVSITEHFTADNPNNSSTDIFAFDNTIHRKTTSAGANIDWQITDNFNLKFDYHSSKAESQKGGESENNFIILSTLNGKSLTINPGDDIPVLGDTETHFEAENESDTHSTSDTSLYGSNLFYRGQRPAETTVDQFKLDAVWDNDSDSSLKSISFGVGRLEQSIHFVNKNNQGNGWSYGGITNAAEVPDELLRSVKQDDFLSAFNNGSEVPDTWVQFDYQPMWEVLSATALANGTDIDGRVSVKSDHRITEDTSSAYLQFDFETDFNGMPFNAVTGVRWEGTEVTVNSLSTLTQALRWDTPTELALVPDAEASYTDNKSRYNVFLPSLDSSLEVVEDVVTRFSYGKSITRPALLSMRSGVSLDTFKVPNDFKAARGNPGLKPFTADNYDLSVEWYYSDASYASVGYFYKIVDNFIVTGSAEETIASSPNGDLAGAPLTDPSNGQSTGFEADKIGTAADNEAIWDISEPVNGETADIWGLEFAVQHMFWDSGFGVQANYTDVSSDVEFDVEDATQSFAITGLSDSANLVAFYDKNGFQARLAYNWRDSFLQGIGQVQITTEPTFTEEYGQWDLSASYDLTDNLTVFFEGINIANEAFRQHGRYEEQLVQAIQTGPRYALGVRANF